MAAHLQHGFLKNNIAYPTNNPQHYNAYSDGAGTSNQFSSSTGSVDQVNALIKDGDVYQWFFTFLFRFIIVLVIMIILKRRAFWNLYRELAC